MIRAVLDSNIIIAGFATDGSLPAKVINHWRSGHFRLIVSLHILDEASKGWNKPYWRARFSSVQVQRALTLLQRAADVTPITTTVTGVATHAEDDFVLSTAISGRADILITGDQGLLDLHSYQNVSILTPRDFLDLLNKQPE